MTPMDELEPSSFGALLRQFRTEAGLTQAELAERAGLSDDTVSTLERGARRRPHRDTARLLADALELTPRDRASFEEAALGAPAYLRVAPALDPDSLPAPPTGSFLGATASGVLVARDHEMGRIEAVLDAVIEGTGQFLLLSGELGIGKTRLAQEATVEARRR
jgi:transcriptional regulator with XRE-family HTH domain